jgi:hypothetical protein
MLVVVVGQDSTIGNTDGDQVRMADIKSQETYTLRFYQPHS